MEETRAKEIAVPSQFIKKEPQEDEYTPEEEISRNTSSDEPPQKKKPNRFMKLRNAIVDIPKEALKKPKRPMSGYNFFYQEQQKNLRNNDNI